MGNVLPLSRLSGALPLRRLSSSRYYDRPPGSQVRSWEENDPDDTQVWVKTHTGYRVAAKSNPKSETHDTPVIRNVATGRKSDMLCETLLTNFYFDLSFVKFGT